MPYVVFICGEDEHLLRTRRIVLEHAGFAVRILDRNDEISTLAETPHAELAVVCHTIGKEEQQLLAEQIGLKWPNAKVLLLNRKADSLRWRNSTATRKRNYADNL